MDRDQLIKSLKGYEGHDIEFKLAKSEVPRSVYETVSAFANTSGGWIVFGVQENNGFFEPAGVDKPDRIQNDFLSSLRADSKVNHDIGPIARILEIHGKHLPAFYIPEATRQNKPIYLNGDIRRTFIRRGDGDHRCRMNEIERFLRDSAEDRWDGQIFDFPMNQALDAKSVRWYRNHFYQVNPGHNEDISDHEFLHQWGYLLGQNGKLAPTRAAIMLFGSSAAMHHVLPRPTLDIQWIPSNMEDPLPEMRWLDRVVYEDNLITTWQSLVARYRQHEPAPFGKIDPHTLMRDDTPPGYRVFREAAVNLLIHQDYADHSRKAVIKFYRNIIQFWNPGDVFGSDEHLLEPGEKEAHNPRIAAAFRRLSLCEQAGTGLRMMQNQWQSLGNPRPQYINDRVNKAFEFGLPLCLTDKKAESQAESKAQLDMAQQICSILADGEKSKSFIAKALGKKRVDGQLNSQIRKLLKDGRIEYTIPEKQNSRLQQYRLSKND
jgi:ATP-dependent DNA helicase RecG